MDVVPYAGPIGGRVVCSIDIYMPSLSPGRLKNYGNQMGFWLVPLTDLSVGAARSLSLALVLGTALLLYLTASRVAGRWTALLAMALFVVQRDIYWAARFFRPEAPMLFWGVLGLCLFVMGHPRRNRLLLALSGVCLALSTMSKLFGALYAVPDDLKTDSLTWLG